MRAPTLAAHAETVARVTDHLVTVLRGADLDEIESAVAELRSLVPPDGVDPVVALIVALAAQIDPTVPFEARTAWLLGHDPARAAVA